MKTSFKYYIFIALFLAICITPFVGMTFYHADANSENRKLTDFPEGVLPDGSINVNYLQGLGDYFNDHFAFRSQMVEANALLHAKLFGYSTVDDVIMGENDWLYYTATLDDYRHMNGVSDRTLYVMAHNLSLQQQYSELLGAQFLFTIAPNKNSLYGENMPDKYKVISADESDAQRFVPYLEDEGVHYVDLYRLFSNQDETLYYKKDSHWNNKGAVLVYNELLSAAEWEHETYETVTPEIVHDYVGDLNRMLYSQNAVPEDDYRYREIFPYAMVNPSATVEDMEIATVNPSADGSLLMYRDSFGNTLLPYMASEFGEAFFSKTVPYPMTDLLDTQADVVIVEKVERHLPTLAQVPPQMHALFVSSPEAYTDAGETNTTVKASCEGDYLHITGSCDAKYGSTKTRFFVKLLDRDECFEAFGVVKASDEFGFEMRVLYEGEDSVLMQIFMENEGEYTLVFDGEAAVK